MLAGQTLAVVASCTASLLCGGGALLCGCDRDETGFADAGATSAPSTPSSAELAPHFVGLSPGRYVAVHFRMAIPVELADIQRRFSVAGKKNAKWLLSYAKKHEQLPPGTPLPYHPKLGISEQEYGKLLKAYAQMKPIEQQRLDLKVRIDGGLLRFEVGGALAPLNGVAISTAGELRYGSVRVKKPSMAQAITGKFGAWSGYYWNHSDSDLDKRTLNALELELGTVVSTGRRFVHFRRKRFDGKKMREDFDLLAWIDPSQPAPLTSTR